MKLADCLSKIDNPKAWDVRFYEDKPLFGPVIRTMTDSITALYREWCSSGPNCPGTEKQVYGIMFANRQDGRTFLVDDSEVMTFQELMEALSQCVKRHNS